MVTWQRFPTPNSIAEKLFPLPLHFWLWLESLLMRRPSLCTQKTNFILFLMVETHYRTSTRGTSILWRTAARYSMLQSSTTIKTSFIIVLKITINKHQNHGIPAVRCMEIASHPISTCDWHFCLLFSLPSITRSDPWGCTLLSATVIQYEHVFYHTKIRNHYSSLHPSVSGSSCTCTSVFRIIWLWYMSVKWYFNLMDDFLDTQHLHTYY